jgi:hypothetical protein
MDKWRLIFADRQGDIFYVDDGVCPKRGASYNYNKSFPGWEPGAHWPGYVALRDLLQLINPPDGVSHSAIILVLNGSAAAGPRCATHVSIFVGAPLPPPVPPRVRPRVARAQDRQRGSEILTCIQLLECMKSHSLVIGFALRR